MDPAKNGAIVIGSVLFNSAGRSDGAIGPICIPKNSFTESTKAKPEPPDAFALITSVRQIARLNIIVRRNVEYDERDRFDIMIILRPREAQTRIVKMFRTVLF